MANEDPNANKKDAKKEETEELNQEDLSKVSGGMVTACPVCHGPMPCPQHTTLS